MANKGHSGAWKTLIIATEGKISVSNNCLELKKVDQIKERHPLADVDTIILENRNTILTYPFISHCLETGIKILFLNEKHLPVGETCPYMSHRKLLSNIKNQIAWTNEHKNLLWQHLIVNKIKNQNLVLRKINGKGDPELERLATLVTEGDTTNIEGTASKHYFPLIFGKKFKRHAKDDINAALNYAYSIIHSYINRLLNIYGYISVLGIHHRSDNNQFNLSYDLIEPWRPLVDFVIVSNPFFDKRQIISLLSTDVAMGNNSIDIKNAINQHVIKCLKFLAGSGKLPDEITPL